MQIVLASSNKKKIKEMETLLCEISPDIEVKTLAEVGYTDEIIEDGTTFAQNSLIKARVAASLGYIGIADDSGLEVDALDGAPGVFSARYASIGQTDRSIFELTDAPDDMNNKKLLYELRDVPDEKRTARYKTVITCAFPNGEYFQVDGSVEGLILREAHGESGFGYDPYFYYPPFGCTFAEASAEDKNSVSHRGKAMKKLAVKFREYLGENNDK